MSVTVGRRYLQTAINDVVVKTSEVTISASLDQLCRVATITVAEQPLDVPSDGDTVLITLIDIDNGVSFDLFGGQIDGGCEVESEPFALIARAVDQLSGLRIAHTGSDLDLTGMTDGEAWKAVADYAGLTYDDADIADSGYVLGDKVAVKWLSDGNTTGAQILAELDRVFGMTTQTIGDNRIIRFAYELLPTGSTGLHRTYTKGADIDFRGHHRSRGSRDDIQTVWVVRGVSYESADGSCTSTVWAKAVHGTAKVGRSRRVPEATDQSDLIQDEALAEEVVRRHMRETSRVPDNGTAGVVTEANLHPGTKIAIIDLAYGIRANPRYFCVTNVEINGLQTDLTLVAGPTGTEGTVTTGVDKVCTDTHTDVDWPGDWTPPAFGFPPLDTGDLGAFDFPAFSLDFPLFIDPDSVAGLEACAPPDALTGCTTTTYAEDVAIEANKDWEITGTLTLNDPGDALIIGVTTDDGNYYLRMGGAGYWTDVVSSAPKFYSVETDVQTDSEGGSLPIGTALAWRLRWEDANNLLDGYITAGDDICFFGYASHNAATFVSAVTDATVIGSPTRSSESIKHNCAGGGGGGEETDLMGVNLDNWVEVNPTFSNGPSTLVVSAEGGAYYPSISIDYATDWHVEATVVIDASASDHQLQVGVGNATGTALLFGVELWDTAPDILFAYARSNSVNVSGTPFPNGSEIDVTLTWHADTEILDFLATDGSDTYSDSVECFFGAPAFALHPMFSCTGTDPDFGGELIAYILTVG